MRREYDFSKGNLASRADDEYERDVAIKLLNPGWPSSFIELRPKTRKPSALPATRRKD